MRSSSRSLKYSLCIPYHTWQAVAFYCVKVRPNEPIKIVDGSTGKSRKGKKKKKEKARNKQVSRR
jgi:hypothetical protein